MFSAPIFRFKRGDHVCVFYDDEKALLDFLVSYFREGIEQGERCFCAQTPTMAHRIRQAILASGKQIDPAAVEIHTIEEVYFGEGNFDPNRLMEHLKDSILDAQRRAFKGIRMAGEMGFAAAGLCTCDELLEYERLVQEAFPDRPVIGVCQYRLDSFAPGIMDLIIASHCKALTDRMVESNHSSLAIRKGRYIIDIVADRENPRSQFYYVAQEHGKRDILGWGVERSFDQAMLQGENLLESLQAAD